jgi:phenylpropionate dioxygenase-like ring-hydroxylating dioxygenase large terminal subunit
VKKPAKKAAAKRKLSLANYWHPIAPAAEVTGQPKGYTLLGERIVAYRDAGGLVALKDLCIHRGTALSLGSIKDGRIVCPYHGWQYDRTGACVHIPSLPEGSTIPKKACTPAYRTAEAYGLTWVALAEPARPIPRWQDDAWDNPAFRVILSGDYLWKSSAGRAVENFMDFSHFNFVHKGMTDLADGPMIKPHAITETGYGLRYAYEDGRIRREYELHAPFTIHDKKFVISAERGATWSEAQGKGPTVGNVTIVSLICSPIAADLTRCFAYCARNHSLDVDDRQFVGGFDTIMKQDQDVVESQRPAEIPTDLREELHLKVPDAAGIFYRRLLGHIGMAAPYQP